MADETTAPTAVTTRLLRAFRFSRRSAHPAAEALLGATVCGVAGAWEADAPRRAYRDEATAAALHLLFGADVRAAEMAGRMLRIAPAHAQRWFQATEVVIDGGRTPLRLDPALGIEVFLTGHGIGVLSIAIEPSVRTLGIDGLLELHYRLAQPASRRDDEVAIHVPHPKHDPERWAKIPEAQRAELERELADPLAVDAPLAKRMARRGSSFTLAQLVGELLAPLAGVGLEAADDGFVVYTVARFSEAVDFQDPATRARFAGLLSATAQVEEPRHAGDAGNADGIDHAVLNRKHWTGLSLQGCAHFVADQPGVPFNEERLPRVRDKYFVPYLIALLQRAAALRATDEASAIVSTGLAVARRRLPELRLDVLQFTSTAALPQVSRRAALQRYYLLCQRSLDVGGTLARVEAAIGALDQTLTTARQTEIAEGQHRVIAEMARGLEASHRIHGALQWIEVFIVIVYATELAHVIGEIMHPPAGGHAPGWWVIAAGLLAGLVALGVLRPWQHRHPHGT